MNIAIGILVAIALPGAYYAVVSAFLPRAFPAQMRYTGISLLFQLCGVIFGGTTPLGFLFLALCAGNFLAAAFLPVEDSEKQSH